MKTWARRIRAAIGMGLTWAATWFAAGILLARIPGFYSDLPFAIIFAPLGFITGIIFSGILVAIGSRRSFGGMSLPRFAAWGAASGLLLSGLFIVGATIGGEALGRSAALLTLGLGTAGAVCAAGSLALARRADRREFPSRNGSDGAQRRFPNP